MPGIEKVDREMEVAEVAVDLAIFICCDYIPSNNIVFFAVTGSVVYSII